MYSEAVVEGSVVTSSMGSRDILELVAVITGMRCAVAARVTRESWIALDAIDQAGYGIRRGSRLDAELTLCKKVKDTRTPLCISDAEKGPSLDHDYIPATMGFRSYVAVPLVTRDGALFGTLCAFDPDPRPISMKEVESMQRLANLYGLHVDSADDRTRASSEATTREMSLAQSRLDLDESKNSLLLANGVAKLREEFIAVLAHDLRNPLQSITMAAEIIGTTKLDKKQLKLVGHVKQSAARIHELIEVTMDFARGRLGGGMLVRKEVNEDLASSLDAVIDEIRQAHPERTFTSSTDITKRVLCDQYRISQLLSNLLINAVIHGSPESVIQVISGTEDGVFRLSVANRGAIPPTKIGRIFEPFDRQGAARPEEGLGLGLYIASQIAIAHDGTLYVTSAEDSGTIFEFQMPLEPLIQR